MKKLLILTVLAFNIIVVPCNAAEEDQNVIMISGLNAHNKYKKNNAVLIDVMPTVDFERFHALGAINLPYDGAEDLQNIRDMKLPFSKNDEVILYCS